MLIDLVDLLGNAMKLSTRSRYGIRAMVDLALHYGEGPVLLKDIAARQGISKKYLDQIFTILKASKLVKSVRGSRGGYILAHHPASITLNRIIEALEGSMTPVDCVDTPHLCPRSAYCATRDVWIEVGRSIYRALESVTLQELAQHQRDKEKMAAR